jgi:hypothetical protein
MLRSSLAAVALLAWSGAAYAQTAGSAVAGVPGGIWIDQDADGKVDAYLLNGEIHLSDGRVVSASPVAPPLAPGAVSVPANWAGLDRLVGKTFHNRKQSFVYIYTWRWLEPAKILAADWTIGASKGTEQWVIDPNTGLPVGYFLDPDGTLGTKPITVRGKTTRLTIKVLGPDAYETRVQVKKKGGWSTMAEGLGLFESEASIAARNASDGDGGFGSILAGAAMGAILGGGGQGSVDLAVAGAQAAAQGGNTLDVLNSMGNVASANAAESKRQLDETIARAEGRTSTGSSGFDGRIGYGAASTASAGAAGSTGTSAGTRTRYTFCIDDRTTRDAKGMIKELIFYSGIGPITRRTDEYFRDTSVEGFAAAVDRISDLQRQSTPNCPQFDTREQAETDFAMKRQIERPDVRPFVYVQDYIPE